MSTQHKTSTNPAQLIRRTLKTWSTVAMLLAQPGIDAAAHAAEPPPTPPPPLMSATTTATPVEIEQQIRAVLSRQLFNPALLQLAATKQHLLQQQQLAAKSHDLSDFTEQFNQLWRHGPWSHVQLAPRRIPANQMAAFVDQMDAGPDAVQLRWEGTVPVLTVNTMLGKDTMQKIPQAFVQLQQSGARQLIIDLRRNKGGAFAVKPLVEHLLAQPIEGGVFASRHWYTQSPQPTLADQDIAKIPVWQQWDLQAFWQALATQPLVRIQFSPAQPVFSGEVWLLTSHQTASAAEMAVAALRQANRVTVIGERTAGQMLSQTMFDLDADLQLSLPIANYFAHQYGPIEGNGLTPDIQLPAAQALPRALALAAEASVTLASSRHR